MRQTACHELRLQAGERRSRSEGCNPVFLFVVADRARITRPLASRAPWRRHARRRRRCGRRRSPGSRPGAPRSIAVSLSSRAAAPRSGVRPRRVRCAPWGFCGVPASASPWASPTIKAVAPIRPARFGHALEVVVDRLDHSGLEQFDERMSGASAIIRAPFHASACMGFIISEATGRLFDRRSPRHGGAPPCRPHQLRGGVPLRP